MAVIPDPLVALSSRLAFPARTVDGYHPSVKNIFGRIQFPHLIFACSTNIDAQISSWSAMWTAFFRLLSFKSNNHAGSDKQINAKHF